MANTKKNNKVKRKRGKKFRFFNSEDNSEKTGETVNRKHNEFQSSNPFEEHSVTKKFVRDKQKRQGLEEEYQTRGKNNVMVDKRIGQYSKRMSDDDKMRLRYLKEQRDLLK